MNVPKHMLKERKGDVVIARCGKRVPVFTATIWHTDVTCPECDRIVHPKRTKRLRKVRSQ